MSAKGMTQMDVVQSLRHLPLPMPKDLAQVFALLGLYDPRDGIEKLISRVDSGDVRPKQIYNAVLRRAPENIEMATTHPEYDARIHFRESLESPEFQRAL